jgi:hypothetical protein
MGVADPGEPVEGDDPLVLRCNRHQRRLVETHTYSAIETAEKKTIQASAGPITGQVTAPAAGVLSPANARSA